MSKHQFGCAGLCCSPFCRTKHVARKEKATGSSPPAKKQKQAAGSSSQPPASTFNSTIFLTQTKADRYKVLKRLKFWPERRVELEKNVNGEFGLELTRRHWGILSNPPAFYDPEVVLEFYANAFPEKNQRQGRNVRSVGVRGHVVDYSRDAIETYLETGMGVDLPEGWRATYQRRMHDCSEAYDDHQTAALLCLDGHTFVSSPRGKALKIMRTSMTWLARVWSTFILHNVSPNLHQSDTRMEFCHLIFAILRNESVDISAIISDELHHRALSKKEERASIGFPALITELCRRSGVPRIRATTPIYDPITDHFITTVKREAARAAEQAPPPPQQQAHPQATPFDPSAPVTMERFTQMMNQMRISQDHLFLQNTALMRGQMHQQEAAYAWMEKHHAGNHSWMSPEAFTIHTAWPGDRPFYPEEGGTHEAAAGDDDQDDDADDADDDGGDYGDIGDDMERDAHFDPFA